MREPNTLRRLERLLIVVSVALAALEAWRWRHEIQPDGVSYLDAGEAFLRGDWKTAVTAYWSPLYSWLLGIGLRLLKPSPAWEFPAAHLVNLLIYLFALVCFRFFWRELYRLSRQRAEAADPKAAPLPEWAWLVLGYTLFTWAAAEVITVTLVNPDLCASALVYCAAGIVTRIWTGQSGRGRFFVLGVVAGLAYLAKAPMLVFGLVFIGAAALAAGSHRKAVQLAAVSAAALVITAGPFALALSMRMGRFTLGDSWRMNYVWHVSGFPSPAGSVANSGKELMRTEVIEGLAIVKFDDAMGGTYPLWYDQTPWMKGIAPRFDLRKQLRALAINAREYYHLLLYMDAWIAGIAILFCMNGRRPLRLKEVAANWHLLAPALPALAMFSLVHVEPRYVGSSFLLLWAALLGAVRLPCSEQSQKLAGRIAIVMAVIVAAKIGVGTAANAGAVAREFLGGQASSPHDAWPVARGLKDLGLRPGDRVAYIGCQAPDEGASEDFGWGRLARVRVSAQVPCSEVEKFLSAAPSIKARVIESLAQTGARMIVGKTPGGFGSTDGWRSVGKTRYVMLEMPRGSDLKSSEARRVPAPR